MASKLADVPKQDDAAEDSGMHGDDRATCHQCQTWADLAHDPVGNMRITQDEYQAIRQRRGYDVTPTNH